MGEDRKQHTYRMTKQGKKLFYEIGFLCVIEPWLSWIRFVDQLASNSQRSARKTLKKKDLLIYFMYVSTL